MISQKVKIGGEGGIRTHDTLASIRAFQARALDQLCDLTIFLIIVYPLAWNQDLYAYFFVAQTPSAQTLAVASLYYALLHERAYPRQFLRIVRRNLVCS